MLTLQALARCRVKDFCIQRGFAWSDSLAKAACAEVEYYEDLLAYYQQNLRVCSTCFQTVAIAAH